MPFILTIIFFITGSRLCTASNTLLPGQTLSENQTLISQNGIYELGFYSDNNFVSTKYLFLGIWLANFSDAVLWVANRGNPIEECLMPELRIFPTGNLVLIQSQKLIWSTNLTKSEETRSTIVVLLDTGNLILKEEGNNRSRTAWQSFDHPTDTWLPGAPLGFNSATGNNIFLTTDPFYSSISSMELDPSRPRGFIIRQLPNNVTYHGIFPQIIDIVDDGNGLVRFNDTHTLIQLVYGFRNFSCWVNDPPSSITTWFSPNNECNFDSLCGPNSLCSGDLGVAACSCPYGFHPAYPENWQNEDYSGGCLRNISLNCHLGRSSSFDDVFIQLNTINKYPDDPQMVVLKDEAECAAVCLSNCSCAAYFYMNNCSLWFGELKNTILTYDDMIGDIIYLCLQVPAIPSLKQSRWSHPFFIILATGVVALLVVGLLIFWKCGVTCFIINKKFVIEDQLVVYSYAETKSITRSFIHKLGEGGFGSVFRGSLPNSTNVAVKRMKNTCFEEKQFRTEVQTIGMIQHINLVKLLGFCSEGSRRLLVYEYMSNGSLDSHLFSDSPFCLSWNTRFKIMVGIARGLNLFARGM